MIKIQGIFCGSKGTKFFSKSLLLLEVSCIYVKENSSEFRVHIVSAFSYHQL